MLHKKEEKRNHNLRNGSLHCEKKKKRMENNKGEPR